MAGNWFSNTVSNIGSAINAPVLFDWDTDAARRDALNGQRYNNMAQGDAVKRSTTSNAYTKAMNEEYGRDANGNVYNQAGDIIRSSANQNIQPQDTVLDGYVAGSGAGGSTAQTAAERAATIGMIDEQIAAIDKALGNTGATWESAKRQVGDAHDKGLNRINEQQSNALTRYATTRSDTKRNFNRSSEDINLNSANKYHALMSLLGRAGSGRSSAAENVVPYAVSQDASKSQGEVADVYSTNMRDVKSAEDETKQSYTNSVNDLAEQRRAKEASLENDIKSKESQYHATRAELMAKRAQAAGGDWNAVKGAMSTDIAKRDEIDRALASLLDNYRNPVTVKDVTVRDPKLANYSTDLNGVAVDSANGTGYDTDTSPEYLARIKEEEKRKAAEKAGLVA